MRHHLLRFVIPIVVISLLTTGCILSKSVDRTFLGATTIPRYKNHKITGLVLLPIAVAADVVTLPIQAVLLVIFGDNYPFEKDRYVAELSSDPLFQKLTDEQKSAARAELASLLRSGAVSANCGLVLCEDGHWAVVELNPEARAKLIARANSAAPERFSPARAH